MKPIQLTLVLALCAPLLTACVSDGEGSSYAGATTARSSGSVVTGSLDAVWPVARSTVMSMGTSPRIDEGARKVEATVSGASVSVTCERYDDTRTILRIAAEKDGQEQRDVADRVQIAIQRNLMR